LEPRDASDFMILVFCASFFLGFEPPCSQQAGFRAAENSVSWKSIRYSSRQHVVGFKRSSQVQITSGAPSRRSGNEGGDHSPTFLLFLTGSRLISWS
jgi:hypothetical protein